MTILEYILISIIAIHFMIKWVKKDNDDFNNSVKRMKRLLKRYEDAYSKMENHFKNENEDIKAKLDKYKETLENLHGVDMDKRNEEWQKEHTEEMEKIRKKEELKRNPYGF